jgi:hypothetical protein
MKADEIEEIVNQLNELIKIKSVDEVNQMTEFDDFKKGAGKLLYEMCVTKTFDATIFKEMMKMKRRLEAGEDQYSVDVCFGKFMADKFVDPVVSKIPPKKNV